MHILFTRSDKIGSKLIQAVTGEPVSHCALLWGIWVIHSTWKGVHVESVMSFCSHNDIIYRVEVPLAADRVMRSLSKAEFRPYDFGALLYLGLRYLIPALPKKNLWQMSGFYLCTEWLTETLDGEVDSLITAYGIYKKLQEKEHG